MGMTVLQIADRLQTEADAYLFMEELRWGDGDPVCPHCGNLGASYIRPLNGHSRKTRTGAASQRRVWRCLDCRKQFSVLTGTIFHGTKVPLRIWLLVIFEMCASKNGVAAREIERKYGVCARTAWFMLHRIREAMQPGALAEVFTGVVVADETYIGGTEKFKHAWKRDPKASGRGTKKTPVLSLIDKDTGEVRSRVIPNITGITLRKAIETHCDPARSILHTDKLPSYNLVGKQFVAHETVDHEDGEYVRGDVSTNQCENFFSQLSGPSTARTTTSVGNIWTATSLSSTTGTAPAR